MEQIDGCINFWESKLKSEAFLLEPSVIVTIETTIKLLKVLRGLESA
ncbi:hypothetical protein LCGC14_1727270 [marine sediment metagenome]|uniref:Uncharacterized protein n=1 Tax=marine sediment metagenome TaxID=412755 RepID=A0A0F9JR88_9ZZZZ